MDTLPVLPDLGTRFRLGGHDVTVVATGTSYDRYGAPYPIVIIEVAGVGLTKLRDSGVSSLLYALSPL